jgi:hypothetical protein
MDALYCGRVWRGGVAEGRSMNNRLPNEIHETEISNRRTNECKLFVLSTYLLHERDSCIDSYLHTIIYSTYLPTNQLHSHNKKNND